ncbi:O-antigen ligase family protein [Silvimonas soli]|uniref:O-antigen ligase family protein n=1 Tax=Silvimonas soli TaxID=2980100 RepID=UPI0024B39C3B|nr:O-antigen ligase family protein [Silvimonas soli]
MTVSKLTRPQPSLAFREEQARPKSERDWKRFRNLWLLANGFMTVNVGVLFQLGNLNSLEKALFLLTSLAYLRSKPVDGRNLALVGGMFAVAWVFGVITPFPDFGWFRFISAAISMFAVLAFFCAWPTPRERLLILHTLALVPVGMVVLGGLYDLGGISRVLTHDYVGVTRLQGNTIPAFLAAAAFAGSVASAFLTTTVDRRFILLTAADLAITFLTATRMPSVAALVAVSAILFTGLRSGVWRVAILVYGASLLAGFVALFGQQLVTRMEDGGTSGRELIWNSLQASLERYPWTGVGFGHHGLLIPENVSRFTGTVAAHNEFLRFAVELGYIGASLFLLVFLGLIARMAFDARNGNRLAFVVSVGMFFLDSYSDNTFTATSCFMVVLAAFSGAALAEPAHKLPKVMPRAMRGGAGPRALSGTRDVRAAQRLQG